MTYHGPGILHVIGLTLSGLRPILALTVSDGLMLTKEVRLQQCVATALDDSMQRLAFRFEGERDCITKYFTANDLLLSDDMLYKGRLCVSLRCEQGLSRVFCQPVPHFGCPSTGRYLI